MSYAIISYLHLEHEIKTLRIATTYNLDSAHSFIKNMCRINLDKIEVLSGILEEAPTHADPDGYYLVHNKNIDSNNRYQIYKKIINIHMGYIWNSASISITPIGFIDILNLDIPNKPTIDNNPIYSSDPIYSNDPVSIHKIQNITHKIITPSKFDNDRVKCKVALISELKTKLNELNLAKVKKD